MSMVVRPQTPQVDAELQGVEFARVLSLVGHYQTYAGQQVLALHQNGDPGTPTPTSAATSASCKKASGAASRSRGNSDCSKQSPGSRSRRYHNNSGARRARLASMSSPGRARATVADPVNTFVERSIKSMQGKILLHMGGSGRKSYDSSYDSSSSTSSSSNIINLEVDCKARPDAPTRTTGCIPAVYDCAGQQLDGSPEISTDPGDDWTLDSASSSSSSSSSEGNSPHSDDAVSAALRDRVQQLEQSNRFLERQVQQLQAEMNRQQQQQHLEQSQGGVMCQFQDVQLQVCLLPGVMIVADSQSDGATSATAAPAAEGAICSDDSRSSCSSCYVIEAPPSPAAVSWLAGDKGQQQQQQQDDECVGITPAILPASNLLKQQQEQQLQQQQQQKEEVHTADPLKSQSPHGHHTVQPSYQGSRSCPGLPATTTDHHQQQLLEEEDYISMILSLQREVSRLQILQQLQQTDYEDLEFVLKNTEKQRREYAARYAFVVLDQDNDGYISTDQVERYELFATYAPEVLARAFQQWRWQSGFPGYLNMEDFVRFVAYADDRNTCTSQRFWFNVLDTDGDGYLGWQDMRQAYEAVDKSSAAYIIGFEDLMNQIRDMVEAQQHPELGFTCSELCGSRLGAGVIALLTNHNNMLLQRSTAEWGRGDFPL